MSEDELYFSEHSNLLPETPASSSNDYTYETGQEDLEHEYLYDYEYQPSEYIIYEEEQQQIEEIPYIIPKPTKKVVWKRPKGYSHEVTRLIKRKTVDEDDEEPPPLDFHGIEPSTTTTNEDDGNLPPPSKKPNNQVTDKSVANFYLQDIRKRSETFKPKKAKEDNDDDDIFERLEQAGCDIQNRQCIHPTCNRRFLSIEVLAYHISYAHQHYSGKRSGTQICLVCGKTFSTGQGKLSHMTSAHKELANEHGRLCLLQGPNTIVF
jgi:hypothetical protein